jgi:hypothetical protein
MQRNGYKKTRVGKRKSGDEPDVVECNFKRVKKQKKINWRI